MLARKKGLVDVTTRDYIGGMKTKKTPILRGEEEESSPSVVKEIPPLIGVGATVSVRAAKARLSALLELVSTGREVTITSDGKPKARLVPVGAGSQRKPFTGTREHLKTMPKWRGGPTADEIVREDRDARGW